MTARLAAQPRGRTSMGTQMRGSIRPHGITSIRQIALVYIPFLLVPIHICTCLYLFGGVYIYAKSGEYNDYFSIELTDY